MDKLTRDLEASIAYERSKRLQPFNPSLSEFSEEHLEIGARAFIRKRRQLECHVEEIETSPIAFKLRDKVEEYRQEIQLLDDLIVQFAGAIMNKERERSIEAN